MIMSHIRTTRVIANKGFSGLRKVVARFNISCTLIDNRPGRRPPLRDNPLLAIPPIRYQTCERTFYSTYLKYLWGLYYENNIHKNEYYSFCFFDCSFANW